MRLSYRNSAIILLAMIMAITVSVRLPAPQLCDSTVKSHQGASTGTKPASRNTAFHLQPESFITQLEECILNAPSKKCHIMYQHVSKTGGKGVEFLFFGLTKHRNTACCGNRAKARFYKNPSKHCPHPFQSFEVIEGFDQMVHTCNNDFYKKSPHNPKVIVLIPLREPISRTLSRIHQRCNKGWDVKDDETKAFCTACSFEKHSDYWMKYPSYVNQDYKTIQNQSTQSLQMFDHLYIDTVDLNKMATMLSERLSPVNDHYAKVFQEYFNQKHNPEKLTHCSFGINSPMMKALKPAIEIYREFVVNGTLPHPWEINHHCKKHDFALTCKTAFELLNDETYVRN